MIVTAIGRAVERENLSEDLARASMEQILAGEATAALRTGGLLIVVDLHPAGACIDTTTLRWRDDYFGGEIVVGHRAQPLGRLKLWTLSEVVNGIVATGLVVRRLEEFPTLSTVRRHDPRLPGAFALVAQKIADPDE